MIEYIRKDNRISAKVQGVQVGYIEIDFENNNLNDIKAGTGDPYRNMQIEMVYVDKEFRRMGIATGMLKLLIQKLKGKVTWLSMWTGAQIEKDKAYTIYGKLGFKQLCVHQDYYSPGIPTRYLRMRLK